MRNESEAKHNSSIRGGRPLKKCRFSPKRVLNYTRATISLVVILSFLLPSDNFILLVSSFSTVSHSFVSSKFSSRLKHQRHPSYSGSLAKNIQSLPGLHLASVTTATSSNLQHPNHQEDEQEILLTNKNDINGNDTLIYNDESIIYDHHNNDTNTLNDQIHNHQPPAIASNPDFSTAHISREVTIESSERISIQHSQLDKKLISQVINAFLLVTAFGFAFYTIFDVDHGMTRGWTVTEKAMRIPLDNWASYESSLNTQPIVTKTTINVIIYLLGDWLSQTLFVKKNVLDFDAVRTLRNGFIGLVFGPLVHEYYEFSDYILPVEVGINRLYKIFMDQTIYLSIKCSIYIIAVNVLAGEGLDVGVDKVKEKLKGIMFTAWKFWPLVHCVTYNVIPARHRILWVNCVDLIWNAILALKTSSNSDEENNIENEEAQTIKDVNVEVVMNNGDSSVVSAFSTSYANGHDPKYMKHDGDNSDHVYNDISSTTLTPAINGTTDGDVVSISSSNSNSISKNSDSSMEFQYTPLMELWRS